MRTKPRMMKKYTPRRRKSSKELLKQQICHTENLLHMDLSSYLILSRQGNPRQIIQARAKIHTSIRRYSKELQAIANDLGERFPELIAHYLEATRALIADPYGKMSTDLLSKQKKCAQSIKNQTL